MTAYIRYGFTTAVAVTCAVAVTGCTERPQLEGAWELGHYEMAGEVQEDVSGVLLMADGQFGLIYTMQSEGGRLSGRGHAGTYTDQQDSLVFDVEWSPEEVDGAARVVPPAEVSAETSREGDTLELLFDSGSVQRWQPVGSGDESEQSGVWKPENMRAAGVDQDAEGILVVSADQFALFVETAGDEGPADVRAYGGTSRSSGDNISLTTNWTVAVVDGEGDVSNAEHAMTLKPSDADTASLRGPNGEIYTLRR